MKKNKNLKLFNMLLKYLLCIGICYLNIFYASETEQDARKTIIKKLKVFFTDKKYYSNNKNFFLFIAKNNPSGFLKFCNTKGIFYDFTNENETLFSKEFSTWVKLFYIAPFSEDNNTFNNNIKKTGKPFKKEYIGDDYSKSLVMILSYDKGASDKEKEYINQLRNVFIELINYYYYNTLPAKQQHGEEIKELFKAFNTQQPNVFSGKQFTFITCLILSSAIYNYFKNNNNKKIIIPLMIIELYFIAIFYISQETQKEQRSEKTTNHHSEKKAITINPS